MSLVLTSSYTRAQAFLDTQFQLHSTLEYTNAHAMGHKWLDHGNQLELELCSDVTCCCAVEVNTLTKSQKRRGENLGGPTTDTLGTLEISKTTCSLRLGRETAWLSRKNESSGVDPVNSNHNSLSESRAGL